MLDISFFRSPLKLQTHKFNLCSHLVALLYQTPNFSTLGTKNVPAALVCTTKQQAWHKVKNRKVHSVNKIHLNAQTQSCKTVYNLFKMDNIFCVGITPKLVAELQKLTKCLRQDLCAAYSVSDSWQTHPVHKCAVEKKQNNLNYKKQSWFELDNVTQGIVFQKVILYSIVA